MCEEIFVSSDKIINLRTRKSWLVQVLLINSPHTNYTHNGMAHHLTDNSHDHWWTNKHDWIDMLLPEAERDKLIVTGGELIISENR